MKSLRCLIGAIAVAASSSAAQAASVAEQWNELLLEAIRNDFARPTVHARNLFHTSIAMWDGWAAYDCVATPFLIQEGGATNDDLKAAREETISFAVFRILNARFAKSPGADEMLPLFRDKMIELGYDPDYSATVGDTPAALGNRIAINILFFGLNDGSNEAGGYANQYYEPINPPLLPALPGNPDIIDVNRWQPLALEFFVDQSGQIIVGGYPEALSPEWGQVSNFSLSPDDLTIYQRDDFDYWVFHDPGPPPLIGSPEEEEYKAGFEQVVLFSSTLEPSDDALIDISPLSMGNNDLGTNNGTGRKINPITGEPYVENIVREGDFYRVLAEFWADGPDSETPPGHWFTLLNYVRDQPDFEPRFGDGPLLDDLQFDVQAYLTMGGAMHDAAVTSWGIKGWYDYLRPISAIRYMCDQGQCSDPKGPSYDPAGIHLYPGFIEVVTLETTMSGQRHEHLAGEEGKIAVYAWRGPDYIKDPDIDQAGVGWILAENWWPYQRPTFVTPPFPGYISGHSTYSRAAAEVLTLITGSEFFPGGIGEFFAAQNEYLVFEEGPSQDVTLQWATYYDAADQSGLSRLYGGIHPRADDFPGRIIGSQIGIDAYDYATTFFGTCVGDIDGDCVIGIVDLLEVLISWGPCPACPGDLDDDQVVSITDLIAILTAWGPCPEG